MCNSTRALIGEEGQEGSKLVDACFHSREGTEVNCLENFIWPLNCTTVVEGHAPPA